MIILSNLQQMHLNCFKKEQFKVQNSRRTVFVDNKITNEITKNSSHNISETDSQTEILIEIHKNTHISRKRTENY